MNEADDRPLGKLARDDQRPYAWLGTLTHAGEAGMPLFLAKIKAFHVDTPTHASIEDLDRPLRISWKDHTIFVRVLERIAHPSRTMADTSTRAFERSDSIDHLIFSMKSTLRPTPRARPSPGQLAIQSLSSSSGKRSTLIAFVVHDDMTTFALSFKHAHALPAVVSTNTQTQRECPSRPCNSMLM